MTDDIRTPKKPGDIVFGINGVFKVDKDGIEQPYVSPARQAHLDRKAAMDREQGLAGRRAG